MKNQSPFPLRMPGDLRSTLENSASENSRSLNNEIVFRLEQSVFRDKESSLLMVMPAMPAKIARQMALDNIESGLPTALAEAINEKIYGACTVGINTIEIIKSEFLENIPHSIDSLNTAISKVKQAFEGEGYKFDVTDSKIIVSF